MSLALSGCSDNDSATRNQASPPPPAVAVIVAQPETLPVISELPGRVAPLVTADIQPRVTGIVQKRVFEQGTTVSEGDLLYQIDPAPFQAAVDSAQATLDAAIAARQLAQQHADRQIRLSKNGVASRETRETAVAELQQSDAEVRRAQAELTAAQLELQYTEIRAPISGRIGRAMVTEGALVGSGSQAMATIRQIDPVYADFMQPADTFLAFRNAVAEGQLQADETGNADMRLVTAEGVDYPYQGRLLFSEASVDAQTGQIILRGEFPNPDRDLLPGMFVRAKVVQASRDNALAVPQQAVQHDTAGRSYVYLVGDGDAIETRMITTGWHTEGNLVITEGLEASDRIVVEGFQKIAPGMNVTPETWEPTAAHTTAGD
ncbi:efflux RND transporter periplasmic adaptor subunit [Martelella mangrovi]|uniref:Membrane fusion protein (Multidrug efflux system) n=1 Tax=Martelella mangrovi TaxID=1397477 RepID=A0ABV2ICM3_9HYPH